MWIRDSFEVLTARIQDHKDCKDPEEAHDKSKVFVLDPQCGETRVGVELIYKSYGLGS
jgi:hypothetical protein